jgi:hypothetical protein
MSRTLREHRYDQQGRVVKGLLRAYLLKMTDLSRAQVTRPAPAGCKPPSRNCLPESIRGNHVANRSVVEMAGPGKRGKPRTGFPRFPPPLEIAVAIPPFPQLRRRLHHQIPSQKGDPSALLLFDPFRLILGLENAFWRYSHSGGFALRSVVTRYDDCSEREGATGGG